MDNTACATPPDIELSGADLEELQHLALSEGCKNSQEAMHSRMARVVLSRVSSQVFHATNNEEGFDSTDSEGFSSTIISIYDKFLSKTPITREDRIILLSTFQFSTNKQRAVDIISKLRFAYGNDSMEFLASYMMDDNDNIDPTKMIGYIMEQIEEYPLVLDENEDNLQELGKVAGVGTYYTCEEGGNQAEKGKKLIFVSDEGKLSRYEYTFRLMKSLGNGLLFGVTQEEGEGSKNELVGHIFENINGKLVDIYTKPGLINMQPEENGMFVSTGGDGKKGLLKEITPEEENRFAVEGIEEKREHRKIIELMPVKEDTIELSGKFILTSRTTHTRSSMGNENKINYISVYDETVTHKHIHEPYYNLRVLFGSSRDMELTTHGYLLLKDENAVSFCKYDEEKEKFHKIEGLQDIKIPNSNKIHDLLDGEITYLEFIDSQKNGLCLLDKKTRDFSKLGLIQMEEGAQFLSIAVVGDKISLFYNSGDGKGSKHKNLWLHNKELYQFTGFIGKARLIGNVFSQLFTDKDIDHFSFQSMQPYLKKVEGPIRL